MTFTARCFPGEQRMGGPPAIAGTTVDLVYDETSGDFDSFIKEGGFGPKAHLRLKCENGEWALFDPSKVEWTAAAIHAVVPDWISCAHTEPSITSPIEGVGRLASPAWSYHIEGGEIPGVGQWIVRFATGPLTVMATDSNSGFPPLRG